MEKSGFPTFLQLALSFFVYYLKIHKTHGQL